MFGKAVAFLFFVLLLIWLYAMSHAHSADSHAEGHANYQHWTNQLDKGCCNNQDCGRLSGDNERLNAGRLEVRVEGAWCPIMSWHYLKKGNAPDWSSSHVCVRKLGYSEAPVSPCERLLCYQPKPLI